MRLVTTGLTLAAIVAAGAGGYVAGNGEIPRFRLEDLPALPAFVADAMTMSPSLPVSSGGVADDKQELDDRRVLFWRDPDGRPDYSRTERKTADGRVFVKIFDDAGASTDAAPPKMSDMQDGMSSDGSANGGKTILYYRNPMGLPDTSPVPKQDSMGMDYIPVYTGPAEEDGIVTISPGRIQRTGVRSVTVMREPIGRPLRVPGVVKLDERLVSVVTARADAFVEEVADVTSGGAVKKGEPLVRMYSPEMASAAAQLVVELKTGGAAKTGGARLRLQNLGVPAAEIKEIERTGQVPQSMVWTAPQDGLILQRMAVDGMMTKAGDVLFRLADATRIWIVVDVPESEIANVRLGSQVKATLRSLPGKSFEGTVDLVYPEVSPATRTVKVRVEVPNPDLALLPDMYADVSIDTGSGDPVVAISNDALLDSGARQVVILDLGEGRFEPKPVKVGVRGSDMSEIVEGIDEGDRVVVGANFLIDAESNIKAALDALEAPQPSESENDASEIMKASEVQP